MKATTISLPDGERSLSDLAVPLPLDELLPGSGEWDVELGFGKGRYLLRRAAEEPDGRFLGIELVGKYYRLADRRRRRRRLPNVVLLCGEALYLMSIALPAAFAASVHVYFPDPWPKNRHQKRRLFDAETVDLLLGLLTPGGNLWFATDHLEYGESVRGILTSHHAVAAVRLMERWPDGARTNYEAKYEAEGRPILRLAASRSGQADGLLHPRGRLGVIAAHGRPAAD